MYINGRTDVCLSFGMWRANGNPTPCTYLDEVLHAAHPHQFKKGFGASLSSAPSPLGQGDLKRTLKTEGHIFKMLSRLQINPSSAGYFS